MGILNFKLIADCLWFVQNGWNPQCQGTAMYQKLINIQIRKHPLHYEQLFHCNLNVSGKILTYVALKFNRTLLLLWWEVRFRFDLYDYINACIQQPKTINKLHMHSPGLTCRDLLPWGCKTWQFLSLFKTKVII